MKNAFIGHVYLITELNKVFIAKNLHPKLFYMIFVTVIMNIVTISVKYVSSYLVCSMRLKLEYWSINRRIAEKIGTIISSSVLARTF